MAKDGDRLIEQLKQAATKRNDIALITFAILYQPDWLYWIEYIRETKTDENSNGRVENG